MERLFRGVVVWYNIWYCDFVWSEVYIKLKYDIILARQSLGVIHVIHVFKRDIIIEKIPPVVFSFSGLTKKKIIHSVDYYCNGGGGF